eukprot:m.31103 g.31103  ORF g.31103 m.31103 type:complete len:547 (-) comp6280_c0_seq1:348-1988(-)
MVRPFCLLGVFIIIAGSAIASSNAQTTVDGTCECTVGQPLTCGCENNAACSDNANGHVCYCTQGSEGDRCENTYVCPGTSDMNYPCNTGTCDTDFGLLVSTDGSYTCTCPSTHVGSNCEYACPSNCTTCMEANSKAACFKCNQGFYVYTDSNGDTSCVNPCPMYYEPNQDDFCERVGHCPTITCENGGTCNRYEDVATKACSCAGNWKPPYCHDNSLCDTLACVHGTCVVSQNGNFATCDCDGGYDGDSCSNNIDDCSPDPCNGESCTDGVDSYTCNCPAWLGGTHCEIQANCNANSCSGNGECTSIQSGISCHCDSGYSGTTCADDFNECLAGPCMNGGTCTTPQFNSYECACPAGFSGDNCELNVCDPSPCMNGGTCTANPLTGNFTCICTDAFVGKVCSVDNPCEDPMLCGSYPCVTIGTSYTCQCSNVTQLQDCDATTTVASLTTTQDPNANASQSFKLEGPVLYGVAAAGGLLVLLVLGALVSHCNKSKKKKGGRGTKAPKVLHSFVNPGYNPSGSSLVDEENGFYTENQMDTIGEDEVME